MVVVHEGREGTIELFSHRAQEAVGGRDFTGHRLSEAFPELADQALRARLERTIRAFLALAEAAKEYPRLKRAAAERETAAP